MDWKNKRGPLRTATNDIRFALRAWDAAYQDPKAYSSPEFCSECGHGATDGYEFEMKTSNPPLCGRCSRYLLPGLTRVTP